MILYPDDRVADFVTRVPVQYLVEQRIKCIGLYLKYWNTPYVAECEAAGIAVVPIWETAGDSALAGASKGHQHGITCLALAQKLGIPTFKAIIATHDTGLYNASVPWYFQAFQTEVLPYGMAGYWSKACADGVRALKVPYLLNWTPAAKSWVQDPLAEIVQFPSTPFPGHPEYRVDMGKVWLKCAVWHPWDNNVIQPPVIPPPYSERGIMTTVYNNAEGVNIDANSNIETSPGFDASTSKHLEPGVGKWRLMEDGSIRHLTIVEYANMAIGKEVGMTSGDLLLFPKWTTPFISGLTNVTLAGNFSGGTFNGRGIIN